MPSASAEARAGRAAAIAAVCAAAFAACDRSAGEPPATRTRAVSPTAARGPSAGIRAADAGAATPPHPELTRLPGAIVFVCERAGRAEIHAVRPDGSGRRVVASSPADAFYPAPETGDRVLAVRVSGGESPDRHREELLLLGPDGSSRALVAAGRIRNPSAGPGGAWVALESDRESFRDIYRVGLDGGPVVRLTESAHGNFEPAVSPDGRRIAFTSSRDGDAEIYVMDARGGRETRLTAFHRDDWSPVWSPRGDSIAFLSAREGRARVFLMWPDGTAQRRLLADRDAEVEEEAPVFSPDGRRLALVVRRADGGGEVWAADPQSGRRWPISARGARDSNPAWSPDGRYLVFASESDGQPDLFAARADGEGAPMRLTGDPAPEWLPRWTRAEWPAPPRAGAAGAAPATSGSR